MPFPFTSCKLYVYTKLHSLHDVCSFVVLHSGLSHPDQTLAAKATDIFNDVNNKEQIYLFGLNLTVYILYNDTINIVLEQGKCTVEKSVHKCVLRFNFFFPFY